MKLPRVGWSWISTWSCIQSIPPLGNRIAGALTSFSSTAVPNLWSADNRWSTEAWELVCEMAGPSSQQASGAPCTCSFVGSACALWPSLGSYRPKIGPISEPMGMVHQPSHGSDWFEIMLIREPLATAWWCSRTITMSSCSCTTRELAQWLVASQGLETAALVQWFQPLPEGKATTKSMWDC